MNSSLNNRYNLIVIFRPAIQFNTRLFEDSVTYKPTEYPMLLSTTQSLLACSRASEVRSALFSPGIAFHCTTVLTSNAFFFSSWLEMLKQRKTVQHFQSFSAWVLFTEPREKGVRTPPGPNAGRREREIPG